LDRNLRQAGQKIRLKNFQPPPENLQPSPLYSGWFAGSEVVLGLLARSGVLFLARSIAH
jgi:hypothetical protein